MARQSMTQGRRQHLVAESARDLATLLTSLANPSLAKVFFGKKIHHRKLFKEFAEQKAITPVNLKNIVRRIKSSMTHDIVEMFAKTGSPEVIEYLGLQQQRDYVYVHYATRGLINKLESLLHSDGDARARLITAFKESKEVVQGKGEGYEAYDWVCNAMLKPAIRHGRWDIFKLLFEYAINAPGNEKYVISPHEEATLRRCMAGSAAQYLIHPLTSNTEQLRGAVQTLTQYFNSFPGDLGAVFLTKLFTLHGLSNPSMFLSIIDSARTLLQCNTLVELFACAKHSYKLSDWPIMLPQHQNIMLLMQDKSQAIFFDKIFTQAPRLTLKHNNDANDIFLSNHSTWSLAYAFLLEHYKPSHKNKPFQADNSLITFAWTNVFKQLDKQDERIHHDQHGDTVDAVAEIVELFNMRSALSDVISALNTIRLDTTLLQRTFCRFAGDITLAVLNSSSREQQHHAWMSCLKDRDVKFGIAATLAKSILKRLKQEPFGATVIEEMKTLLAL